MGDNSGRKFTIYTFGCKANQYDSNEILQSLRWNGEVYTDNKEEADLHIINTCSVTERSDYKARQLVRKIRRANPEAKIVVTGCYAEREAPEIKAMSEIDLLLGNRAKQNFPDALIEAGLLHSPEDDSSAVISPAFFAEMESKTRAFVKIQDGCDQFCSYCIVPHVRGRSRSISGKQIISHLIETERNGYKEAILTGIHIGKWGTDLPSQSNLLNLLKRITDETDIKVRLSSLEPLEATEELIDFVLANNQIRPHFHIPLQSGSAAILKTMNRPYQPEEFIRVIDYIHAGDPDAGIGSDVIVGFPGETDADFEATKKIINELPFSYLHIFPFSERPGTAAAKMKNKVHDAIITERAAELQEYAARKKNSFIHSRMSQPRTALTIKHKKINGKNYTTAITDNYIRVHLAGKAPLNNEISVKITEHDDGITYALPV